MKGGDNYGTLDPFVVVPTDVGILERELYFHGFLSLASALFWIFVELGFRGLQNSGGLAACLGIVKSTDPIDLIGREFSCLCF